MAEGFLGEIRLFSFAFSPRGWAACDGQILPIKQNQALYSLLSTLYGGNGNSTFGLPDLRSRVPLGFSSIFPLGKKDGVETLSLSIAQMPTHSHSLNASKEKANEVTLGAALLATTAQSMGPYAAPYDKGVFLTPASISNAGDGLAHSNIQPYLSVNFCIALTGTYPPQPETDKPPS